MNRGNTTTRYSTVSIGLHWLMLLLLVAVYACMELRDFFPKGSDPREALKHWHFMLGLSVLALVLVRLVARFSSPTPAITPTPPPMQMLAGKLLHLGLYALMIGMPLLGWLLLSAAGKPVPFFGLELPALLSPDKELAGTIKEIHETFATLGYFMIGLHAAAAIYHHHIVKDNTLLRMLPERK
ncbi:MAG TPA: cytochrome b [Pseudomonadales bacterium]|nr:cytochrome b [Pseudomonadales bacterium]